MKKITLSFFFFLFSSALFAQDKIPVYIFGTHKGGFDGYSRDNVLQLFSDSTFTLTNYRRYDMYMGTGTKSEMKGHYIKHGDTLFLDDVTSRIYPFLKKPDEFQLLAKNDLLQLMPAKIILSERSTCYLSYINKWVRLNKLQFLTIAGIEKLYFPFKSVRKEIEKNVISPQLSNKRNSF